ncbi:PREDICTED: zinc finger X-chromosomal protein-like [Nicrophorus vespilloides]|uniref:Zinc finger X-chromosomal protein-like n=1 Tax=Nicrophorus vespilloides TaxID=110193 RepID=A0ABM1N9L0_NICVS|nr:PREDICTED: zinc finger X-chromosomal protein-like [Nicrophorus vespilloides]XP_017783511.1 PREDICTED: zinc finger X-chromosomal protein-like [Nicrophorus vespilloides]
MVHKYFYCIHDFCVSIGQDYTTYGQHTLVMQKKYACLRCGKSYRHQSNLSRHKNKECGKEKKFVCQLCSYRSFQKIHLMGHMYRKHLF